MPLVLPVKKDGSEPTVKSTTESLHPEHLQGELIRPETEIEQREEGQKHGQMIKEEERPKPSSLQGKNCFELHKIITELYFYRDRTTCSTWVRKMSYQHL